MCARSLHFSTFCPVPLLSCVCTYVYTHACEHAHPARSQVFQTNCLSGQQLGSCLPQCRHVARSRGQCAETLARVRIRDAVWGLAPTSTGGACGGMQRFLNLALVELGRLPRVDSLEETGKHTCVESTEKSSCTGIYSSGARWKHVLGCDRKPRRRRPAHLQDLPHMSSMRH